MILDFVSPHERSDMRDFPGYRFAHPGYGSFTASAA
jgi:hypothetical protein